MIQHKPDWLTIKYSDSQLGASVANLLKKWGLHTVCEEADCPNLGECFGRGTATFMILGDTCTRNCTFCAVRKGSPEPPDLGEPQRVAQAVRILKLRHVVITTVTRDDIADGGALQFEKVINAIRATSATTAIEVLISDLSGNFDSLKVIVDAHPDILGHNVETVPRLYSEVRPKADYRRSLELLKRSKILNQDILTKSGIMVGLGEKHDEVLEVFQDLRIAGCDILTIGQYLAPF
jgi:lipoic acid synthetase